MCVCVCVFGMLERSLFSLKSGYCTSDLIDEYVGARAGALHDAGSHSLALKNHHLTRLQTLRSCPRVLRVARICSTFETLMTNIDQRKLLLAHNRLDAAPSLTMLLSPVRVLRGQTRSCSNSTAINQLISQSVKAHIHTMQTWQTRALLRL